MMQHDAIFLLDIIDSAKLVGQYVQGKELQDFTDDVGLQDKVARRLVVIGEASIHLSPQIKDRASRIPWLRFQALRNLLVHHHDEVDLASVWRVVVKDVPSLISELQPLVGADET
jgi:uncharacterized protein with HEPN domain